MNLHTHTHTHNITQHTNNLYELRTNNGTGHEHNAQVLFPMGALLHLHLYLQPFLDIGSRLELSGSREVIRHVIIRFPIGHVLFVVLWNRASIGNIFHDIQRQM